MVKLWRAWIDSHVSEMRGDERRLYGARLVLCAATLVGLASSPKLWFGERLFPDAPLFQALEGVSSVPSTVLSAALAACLLVGLVVARPGRILALASALGAALVFLDQTRLQPWFYQYIVMLAILALAPRSSQGERGTWAALAIVVGGIYLWSGLQKANMAFVGSVFPSMLEALGKTTFEVPESVRNSIGFIVPPIEAAIGGALLFPRTRAAAALAAIGMHIFLLVMLSPLGLNYNPVVWPWNFAMIGFIVILFWRSSNPLLPFLRLGGSAAAKCAAALFLVMPALSFLQVWDDYLSSSLYSGLLKDGAFLLNQDAALSLPEGYDRFLKSEPGGTFSLDVTLWAFAELGVPPYPERRAYEAIERDLCANGIQPGEMILYWRERPNLLTGERRTLKLSCCER